MTSNEYTTALIQRLAAICSRHGWSTDKAAEIWSQGLTKIEEKRGVRIYLSSFIPEGFVESEQPTAKVTITPEWCKEDE